MYPNAKITEWKRKGSDAEKQIRVLQLIDPDVDVLDSWTNDEDQEPTSEETGESTCFVINILKFMKRNIFN